MKRPMNFRFSPKTIAILIRLEKDLQMPKTTILEQAVQDYAKKKLLVHSELLQFAGKLDSDKADEMLKAIRSSRRNKNKEIKL